MTNAEAPLPTEAAPAAEGAVLRRPWWRQPVAILAGSVVLVLAVGAILLVTLAGGGSHDLKVTFSLYDFAGTSTCDGGSGGYSDLGPGTDVVVEDNDGHVVATAQLGDGEHRSMSQAVGQDVGGCIWSTTVKDVPTGKHFYRVSVGHRGTETYSQDQLDKNKWDLSLEVGSSS